MYGYTRAKRLKGRGAVGILALLALALGGCAGSAIEDASPPPAQAVAVKRSARQCENEIGAKPEYESLRAKIDIESGGTDARLNRSHQVRPTGEETALLNALNVDLRECRRIALGEVPATRTAKLTQSHAATETLWAEAAAGRLSWDQFNRRRKAIADRERSLLSDPSDTVAAAPRTQDRFSLDQRDVRPEFRGAGHDQLYVRNPSISISGPTSPSGHCGVMSNSAYCASR
jgi:hypothetical protein